MDLVAQNEKLRSGVFPTGVQPGESLHPARPLPSIVLTIEPSIAVNNDRLFAISLYPIIFRLIIVPKYSLCPNYGPLVYFRG